MLLRALTFICFILPTALVMADDKGTQKHLDHIETTARKPNVLLIYSDDFGWADLGVQGVDKKIRTPHRQGFDEYFRGEMRQYYASRALESTPLSVTMALR